MLGEGAKFVFAANEFGFDGFAAADIGDGGADEFAVERGHPDEADFAHDEAASGVAVHPFELDDVAGDGSLEVVVGEVPAGDAGGLVFGADRGGALAKEFLAGHAEEAAGVVVDLDEVTELEVVDEIGVGGVVEDGAEALFGVAGAGEGLLDGGMFEHEGEAGIAAAVADVLSGDANLENPPVACSVAPVGG